MLEESAWVSDDSSPLNNVRVEQPTTVQTTQIYDFGEDYEHLTHGYIHYLLLNDNSPMIYNYYGYK